MDAPFCHKHRHFTSTVVLVVVVVVAVDDVVDDAAAGGGGDHDHDLITICGFEVSSCIRMDFDRMFLIVDLCSL
jgi:hypothetical protein